MNEDQVTPPAVEVRDIVVIAEMRATEAVQRDVWGLSDIDIVPAAQLKAAVHAGGQLVGAFAGGEMLGFAYGLVATPHGPGMNGLGLHSHMVAVLAQGRQRGVGRALKWYQRDWCLARGMRWISWTFDPLQARNANLNFEHLGVVSHEYLPDFYGAMAGPLGGDASDRLVALWLLDSEPVTRRAEAWRGAERRDDEPVAPPPPADDVWLLRPEDVTATRTANYSDDGSVVAGGGMTQTLEDALSDSRRGVRLRVAAPTDVGALGHESPQLVAAWRTSLRATLIPALAAGYHIVGFSDGAYSLVRQ